MARYIGAKESLIVSVITLLVLLLSRFMRFSAINYKQGLRGCDAWGCGDFGASRGNRKHKGLDFFIPKGNPVYAPFPCEVIRLGYPYADDLSYRLVEVQGIGGYSDYKAKIMYVTNLPAVGTVFHEKQQICVADDLARKYDARMTNHVHFELYANGELVNPEIFF